MTDEEIECMRCRKRENHVQVSARVKASTDGTCGWYSIFQRCGAYVGSVCPDCEQLERHRRRALEHIDRTVANDG